MVIYSIVVTYNGSKWIDKCFGSLVNSSIPLKILAIDNCSTDGTPDILREKFPTVEVIETGQNLGFGKANNIGLKRVLDDHADYAFLFNQDAWVEPDTIEKLIDIHKRNQQFGVLAPLQLNGDGSLIDKLFLEFSVAPCRELLSDLLLKNSIKKDFYETNFVNAACWLLPYFTLEKIGGFDPLYPHYGEDDDYINRIKYHGMKVGLCPTVKVFHDREYCSSATNWNNLIIRAFISLLVQLKNNSKPQLSKTYYIKKMTLHILNGVFGKNKTYHLAQYQANWKILRKYNIIIEHRTFEGKQKPHYLTKDICNETNI